MPTDPPDTRSLPEREPTGSDPGTDALLLLLALIWGVNFSVIKVALLELHPFAFNALRFPLASFVLYLLLRFRGALPLPRAGDRLRVLGLGVLGHIVYQPLFILGLNLTSAGNASLLLATTPIWILLLSVALGQERPSSLVWTGIGATVLGMLLIVEGGAGFDLGRRGFLGDVLMVLSALAWALYTVGAREPVQRYGALAVTAWTLWIGTAGLVLMGLPWLDDVSLRAVSPRAWAGVAYAGALAISVAYAIWYRGVRRLGSARTAAYSNLVPVVALVVAWIWLGETPSGLQLAGAGVILGGLSLARFGRSPASSAWGRRSFRGGLRPPRGDAGAAPPGTRRGGSPPS